MILQILFTEIAKTPAKAVATLGPERIVRIPFTIGSHEEISSVDFEDTCKDKFRNVIGVVFWDENLSFYIFSYIFVC